MTFIAQGRKLRGRFKNFEGAWLRDSPGILNREPCRHLQLGCLGLESTNPKSASSQVGCLGTQILERLQRSEVPSCALKGMIFNGLVRDTDSIKGTRPWHKGAV